jgi:hypothetical protein
VCAPTVTARTEHEFLAGLEDWDVRRLAGALFIASLLLALLPGAVSAVPPPGTLDQSSVTGITDFRSMLRPSGVRWIGHTFTAGKTGLLTRVELYLFLEDAGVGNPPTATVEIYPTDAGSGMPTGSALASASLSVSSLSPTWYGFAFTTPPQVTTGTKYAIVVTGSPDGYASWYYSDVYAAGQNIVNTGSGWSVVPNYGRAFRTYVFQGPTMQWSATSVVAGTTANLTLTETFAFQGVTPDVTAGAQPAGLGPYYIEQVALPGWFTVTGASCSSQVIATCDATNFLAGAKLGVTPDGNPITVTLTGTASPPSGAAGTKGTASGLACVNSSDTPFCAAGSADISILAPGSTPPPTATGTGDKDASDTNAWWLPAALIALLGATFVSMRRRQPVR